MNVLYERTERRGGEGHRPEENNIYLTIFKFK